MNNLSLIIVATQNFQYALKAQARAIKQNFISAGINGANVIYVTCETPFDATLARIKSILGDGFTIHHLPLPVKDGATRYKQNAQLLICKLYTAGFDLARNLDSDAVWTLESDVLPEPTNLRCMRDMLYFDNHYYDIAFCPYVSSGGGGIMGGRGNERNHILPNVYDDEYAISEGLEKKLKEHRAQLPPYSEEWHKENGRIVEEIKKQPAKGNVFALNSKNWRKRGWLESAYPGIGKGAVLESDWGPMGNNLFSKKALNLVDFTGYVGVGTQDLFLVFRRLKQYGIRLCVIPHSVSHHVIRKDSGFKIIMLRHEPDGEFEGHLRQEEIPWFSHEPGESVPVKVVEDYLI